MLKQTACRSLILAAVAAISFCITPVRAEETAKWFVVRLTELGTCSTAVLIRVDGAYRVNSGRIAGGPYDTEAAAREREAELERTGTCVTR